MAKYKKGVLINPNKCEIVVIIIIILMEFGLIILHSFLQE